MKIAISGKGGGLDKTDTCDRGDGQDVGRIRGGKFLPSMPIRIRNLASAIRVIPKEDLAKLNHCFHDLMIEREDWF